MMNKSSHFPVTPATDRFHDALDYEFVRAARYGNHVTLVFITIDELDEIGKDWGEVAVSELISEIDLLIRDNIRDVDREFVYGKNEFMIILPHTTREGARNLVPKLRRLIEDHRVYDNRWVRVTLKPRFGISSYRGGRTVG